MDEHRFDPRVAVKPPCRARFKLAGMSYTNIQVLNLGTHGCCVLIPMPTVNRFAAGPVLDAWKLSHPKLPKEIIKAKVVWCRNQGKANPGFMEAGVQFLDVPPVYSEKLAQFLAPRVRSGVAEGPFPQGEGGAS